MKKRTIIRAVVEAVKLVLFLRKRDKDRNE